MSRPLVSSLALALLVFLSLGLTFWLWYGEPAGLMLPPLEPEGEPAVGDPGLPPPGESVVPLLVAYAGAEGRWQGFGPGQEAGDQAWQAVRSALARQEPWPSLEEPGYGSEELDLEREGTWVFDLPQPLRLKDWAALLGNPAATDFRGPRVRQVVVDPAGRLYWHDGQGNLVAQELSVSLTPPPPGEGWDLVWGAGADGEGVAFAPGVFLPREAPLVQTWRGQVARVPPREEAAVFFSDMSLVREIQERDDAFIYTDGQRALRVYPSGRLEYSFPELEPSPEAPEPGAAWERARGFLGQHGGWPSSLALGSLQVSGEEVSIALYQHHQGLVLLEAGPALHLTVGGSGVSFLERQRVEDLDSQAAGREAVDVLEVSRDWVRQGPEEELTVQAVRLALVGQVQSGGQADFEPVWWLETREGEELAFCALTGEYRELPRPAAGPGEEEGP